MHTPTHVQSHTHTWGLTYVPERQEVAPALAPAGHRAAGGPGERVGCKPLCQARAAQQPAPQLWGHPLPSGKPKAFGCCVCPLCQELGTEMSLFYLCTGLQPVSTLAELGKQDGLHT